MFNCQGDDNVAVGYGALQSLNDGGQNTAIGYGAGGSGSTNGYYNTAIGFEALKYAAGYTNSNYNVGVGWKAFDRATNSTVGVVAIGKEAGAGVDNGTHSVFIGYEAAHTNTYNLPNCIVIGGNANPSATNVANEITLGDSNISLFRIPGINLTIGNNGANIAGVVTATSFSGSGTSGIKLPVGTTAQRDNTQGMLRYNSTLELPEYYKGTAWVAIDSPPIVSSISPTEVESAAGGNITFTINGERFNVGATVKFVSNTGVELTPSPVTRVSGAQLTAVIARNSFVNAQEPYDVKVINASGLSSTLADQINVDNAPTWNTSAGTIATIGDLATGTHATLSATDADGDTVAYSIVSGSIPAGTSLNSATGVISGDPTNVNSSTTSSFTARVCPVDLANVATLLLAAPVTSIPVVPDFAVT